MRMTGQQLLHELALDLEQNLTSLPEDSPERQHRERDLEDRSLWSARRRSL
jgi:hypothetical protein